MTTTPEASYADGLRHRIITQSPAIQIKYNLTVEKDATHSILKIEDKDRAPIRDRPRIKFMEKHTVRVAPNTIINQY
jgi:hypothetical protein